MNWFLVTIPCHLGPCIFSLFFAIQAYPSPLKILAKIVTSTLNQAASVCKSIIYVISMLGPLCSSLQETLPKIKNKRMKSLRCSRVLRSWDGPAGDLVSSMSPELFTAMPHGISAGSSFVSLSKKVVWGHPRFCPVLVQVLRGGACRKHSLNMKLRHRLGNHTNRTYKPLRYC